MKPRCGPVPRGTTPPGLAAATARKLFSLSRGAASLTLTSSSSFCSLALQLLVEVQDVFGEAERFGPGDTQCQFFLALAPGGDLLDLVSFPRASMPSALPRTKALSALTERVRSAAMAARAVTRIRRPWRIPSFKRGRRKNGAL